MERILRRNEVETRTGLSRSAIYAAMTAERFPRPVRIGVRAVGWRETDLSEWIATRTMSRGGWQ